MTTVSTAFHEAENPVIIARTIGEHYRRSRRFIQLNAEGTPLDEDLLKTCSDVCRSVDKALCFCRPQTKQIILNAYLDPRYDGNRYAASQHAEALEEFFTMLQQMLMIQARFRS
ncbi:MAG: hypothetical protein VZT48_02285 [Bulleidia sp.]|nr:hypothetical protein [Bulleidia sp.]